jgi:hypothetical protein
LARWTRGWSTVHHSSRRDVQRSRTRRMEQALLTRRGVTVRTKSRARPAAQRASSATTQRSRRRRRARPAVSRTRRARQRSEPNDTHPTNRRRGRCFPRWSPARRGWARRRELARTSAGAAQFALVALPISMPLGLGT